MFACIMWNTRHRKFGSPKTTLRAYDTLHIVFFVEVHFRDYPDTKPELGSTTHTYFSTKINNK